MNLTSEFDCPQRLQPGDMVKASIEGRYHTFIVREVERDGELRQNVIASFPGQGSVRFSWFGGHHRSGTGHGLRFYFVRRPKKESPG